jgi:predicted transcriptional regulator
MYNGKNNGDLSASFKNMKAKGWRSETTLSKALNQLLEYGFLVKTRQGGLNNTCNLYGLTWKQIDQSTKYDTQQYTGKVLAWWKN